MITFTVLTRLSFTFFSVPYAALAAELSEHYEERTTIMTYRIALGWLVGAVFIFCMYSLMFTSTAEHTNGLLDPRHYAGFGLLLSVLMMGWMTITTLGTLNQIPYLPQPTEGLPRIRLASLLTQTLSALQNRNFRLLFLATLLSAAINGTGQVFDIYMNLYFWQFGTDDIRWFSFALLGAAMAFVSVGWLQTLFEKHQIMMYAMSLLMVMAMLKVGLRFLQVWPENGEPSLLPMLVVHASIMAYGGSLVLIMFASMIADIVDEQEHLTSMRQEGTFSAGVSLAGKSMTGLGLIIGGLLLDWLIALPAGATPETITSDVVIRLGVVDGLLVPAFYLIPILLIRNYRLDRHQLSRLQQQIRQRRSDTLDQEA
jgi:Na+/melibiose symporter-like transporter